jgi:hypothetical protein
VVKTPEEVKSLEAKLCETLLTLGEVSLESENYEQAVADITECLNMRKVRDDYSVKFTFIEFSESRSGKSGFLKQTVPGKIHLLILCWSLPADKIES